MVMDQLNNSDQGPVRAGQLAELLQISLDSIYRRLRGNTPFTLTELVRIAEKYPLSLDAVLFETSSDDLAFHVCTPLSQSAFQKLWNDRVHATFLLRDLPAELLVGLPRLDQLYAPFALTLPDIRLVRDDHWEAGLENVDLILSGELMEQFIFKLRSFKRQIGLTQSAWEQLFSSELNTLFNRLSSLLCTKKSRGPRHLYSPDAAPSNLLHLEGQKHNTGVLFHESGLPLCNEHGALGRWISLQFKLWRHTSVECPSARRDLCAALLRNWHKDCLNA